MAATATEPDSEAPEKKRVKATVKRHVREVRACYEKELIAMPTLEGMVRVRIVIGTDGRVTSAQITSSMGKERMEACILTAVRTWAFDPFPTVTVIDYPFQLRTEQ